MSPWRSVCPNYDRATGTRNGDILPGCKLSHGHRLNIEKQKSGNRKTMGRVTCFHRSHVGDHNVVHINVNSLVKTLSSDESMVFPKIL